MVERGKEDAPLSLDIVSDDRALFQLQPERRLDKLGRDIEQLLRQGSEFINRQAAMPFVHGLGERV